MSIQPEHELRDVTPTFLVVGRRMEVDLYAGTVDELIEQPPYGAHFDRDAAEAMVGRLNRRAANFAEPFIYHVMEVEF